MMSFNSDRGDLAREALAAARRVRIRAKLAADGPLCIFDLIDSEYRDIIDLRFKAAPSLEGLYVRGEPEQDRSAIIVISSLRPSGRQRSTAGHELGHHEFGHGSSIDEVREAGQSQRFEPKEYVATQFSSFLLMPKLGVLKAFADRKLKIETASAIDVYAVASQFGVGFSTLVNHLTFSLKVLSRTRAEALKKVTPQALREDVLGHAARGELLVVDAHWSGRAIDLSVNDHVVVPVGTNIERLGGDAAFPVLELAQRLTIGDVYRARRVGRARVVSDRMASYVRVSRMEYAGRSMFRHLEDEDE